MVSARSALFVGFVLLVCWAAVGSQGGGTGGVAAAVTPTPTPTETPAPTNPSTQNGTVFSTPTETPRGTNAWTPTTTPSPYCLQYRGAGAGLCEPTTTAPTQETPLRSGTVDDGSTASPPPASEDWLSGLLPLVAWIGAVAVFAPLVLGGLLAVESLRGGR